MKPDGELDFWSGGLLDLVALARPVCSPDVGSGALEAIADRGERSPGAA
jgi:hypothetical protein